MRSRLLESGQYIVSPVDIRIQRGEFVVKRVADEALRREVIAFVGLKRMQHPVDAGIALERTRVKRHLVQNTAHSCESMRRILERHPADQSVDLIALLQKQLGEVRTVLTRNTRNQCLAAHL